MLAQGPKQPAQTLGQAQRQQPANTLATFDTTTPLDAYGKESFWNTRYTKDTGPFEWFVSLDDCKKANPTFEQLLKSRVQSKARVLEVGCGTSTLAAQLFDMGFHDVTAIDYVDAAIRAQKERQVGTGRKVIYEVNDMRKLTLADNTFDLIVDKGAMDALVCASPAEAQKGAQELWRVLKKKRESIVIVLSNAPLVEIPAAFRTHFDGTDPFYVRNSELNTLMAKCYMFQPKKTPIQ